MTTPPQSEPLDPASRRAAAWADLYLQPDYPPVAPDPAPVGARSTAARVATLIGEVLAGQRPAQQLARWLDALSAAQLARWLARHRRVPVRLAAAHFTAVAPGVHSCMLRYAVGSRSLIALVELAETAGRWRCRKVDLMLPGPTPTGIMPRWGYDRDTA